MLPDFASAPPSLMTHMTAALIQVRALLQQPEHGGGLIEGFAILVVQPGIGNDAATGPETDDAFGINQRADGDVAVHRAVEADVADGAAIYAATVRLELLDDLHRAQ